MTSVRIELQAVLRVWLQYCTLPTAPSGLLICPTLFLYLNSPFSFGQRVGQVVDGSFGATIMVGKGTREHKHTIITIVQLDAKCVNEGKKRGWVGKFFRWFWWETFLDFWCKLTAGINCIIAIYFSLKANSGMKILTQKQICIKVGGGKLKYDRPYKTFWTFAVPVHTSLADLKKLAWRFFH